MWKRDYTMGGSLPASRLHTCYSEPDLAWKCRMAKRPSVSQQLLSKKNPQKSKSQYALSSNSKHQRLYTQNGTKIHQSFICPQIDGSKTSPKPVAIENAPKRKGSSG